MQDIDIKFEDDEGFLCDLVIFKDINNEVLGIAKIDSMNFTLPVGTIIFDYYHQFDNTRPHLTRCVLGTKEHNKNDNHVYVTSEYQDITKTIQVDSEDENCEIKIASNEEEFLNLLKNEMLTRKYLKEALQKETKEYYEKKEGNLKR